MWACITIETDKSNNEATIDSYPITKELRESVGLKLIRNEVILAYFLNLEEANCFANKNVE